MNTQDRRVIGGLFEKLREAERRSRSESRPPRLTSLAQG
jgi:hypothetical protein